MKDERDPSTFYNLFRHVAHKLQYSKDHMIGGNSTSVQLTSGGIHVRCADLGSTPTQWQKHIYSGFQRDPLKIIGENSCLKKNLVISDF
jgi:hypothetical protein